MFKVYRIYDKDNKYFDVDIKNKKIAQQLCNYYSKRDNINYKIKTIILEIGLPEYRDKEIFEVLKNV